MTVVTTWNKGKTPATTNGWLLVPDVRAAVESLNVVVPVADQAERDGITPPLGTYVGMAVTRADLDGLIEIWDGTEWLSPHKRLHAEYTGPAFTTTAATGTNFSNGTGGTPFVEVGSKTFNNDFVQPDVGGRLKILTTGVYSLSGIILPTTVPASFSINITDVTASTRLGCIGGVGYGDKEQSTSAPNVYLAANTVIEFNLVTSNAVTLGSRVRVTKIQ